MGEASAFKYPQPEGTLGETMVKGGQDLGEDSLFGKHIRCMKYTSELFTHWQIKGWFCGVH